jgi:hypothetical protein
MFSLNNMLRCENSLNVRVIAKSQITKKICGFSSELHAPRAIETLGAAFFAIV